MSAQDWTENPKMMAATQAALYRHRIVLSGLMHPCTCGAGTGMPCSLAGGVGSVHADRTRPLDHLQELMGAKMAEVAVAAAEQGELATAVEVMSGAWGCAAEALQIAIQSFPPGTFCDA